MMIPPLLDEVLSSRDSTMHGDRASVSVTGEDAPFPLGGDAAAFDDDEVVIFPATLAQRRFWLLDQLVVGGNSALNMPLAIHLIGALDTVALEKSFNEVIRRHEALRTTFHYEKGNLLQVIAPVLEIKIPLVEATDFPAAERASVPAHILAEEACRPFDLKSGPLVRARLVRLGPNEHLLVCPTHHIVADGWSNGIFVRELGALYTASAQSKPSPLPEPTVHFADFAQWQNGLLNGGDLETQLDYWRGKLAGELPVLDLPTNRPRAPWGGQAPHADICARQLPGILVHALKALSAREGCSLFIMMTAILGILLNRYAPGQEDILIATSTANRQRLELENIIGLFVNPLLLRLDLGGAPTVKELLGRVRRVVLEAFENADLPFEKLLEELQPRRLQVSFLYQQDFVRAGHWGDLKVAPEEPGSGGAVYEWNLIALEDEAGLRLHCEYNTELFDAGMIERLLVDYEGLLTAAVATGGLDLLVTHLRTSSAAEMIEEKKAGVLIEKWRLPDASLGWLNEYFAPVQGAERELVQPLPSRLVAVLDESDQPAPVGVFGELCLFLNGPESAVIRTGDIAVQQDDGVIAWVGPSGTECKVNGLRIDRQKIETALRLHPHVKRAVVLWREDEQNTPLLTAYYEGDGAPAALLTGSEIRGFLQDHLPDDWIPEACVHVQKFPLTMDGRLDADQLPAPVAESVGKAVDIHGTPYLALHHQIVEIWREIIGVRSLGIRDDFFDLGGNSLSAMRMLYRVEQAFGKALLPAALFQRATVEHLADEILKQDAGIDSPELVRVQESGNRTPIFFLHGDIAGGGFYCLKLARDLGPDQPFYALPPVEVDRPLEDRPTIEGMAASHVATIRSARPHGPYIIGGFCIGGVIAFEVAHQLVAQGETVEQLVVIDAGPIHRRLAMLRAGVERWARRRGLDSNHQLYLFCRWHHWLARWDQYKRLGKREFGSALFKRFQRLFRRREAVTVDPAATLQTDAPTAWFDARLDVPLVFLWALGAYRAKPYSGQMVLMLSSDLIGGAEGGNPTADWRRLVTKLEVAEVQGNHLACITEHVSGLAAAMRRYLKL